MNFFITAELIANVSCSSLQGCTELTEGQPFQGALSPRSTDYFYVPVDDATQALSLTLSPLSGQVDFYATLDGSLPSPSNAAFFSNATSGVDYFSVPASALMAANASFITVAVYAPGPASNYFVWFTAGSSNVFTQLPDGVSFDFSQTAGSYCEALAARARARGRAAARAPRRLLTAAAAPNPLCPPRQTTTTRRAPSPT
jgi:hypothetical protein